MNSQVIDDTLTVDEVLQDARKMRRELLDIADTVETLIQFMPESLYYYDSVQTIADDLLQTLRKAWALADELAVTIIDYRGGER